MGNGVIDLSLSYYLNFNPELSSITNLERKLQSYGYNTPKDGDLKTLEALEWK